MTSKSDQIIRIEYPCGYLGDNEYLSDFIIGTNDGNRTKKYTKIYTHRVILGTVSKFFRNKFDSNPTLEYFLLPKQFRSKIMKFVIFCIYNQHVNIDKKYLSEFLEAVKYLQINGFEEIQQTNLECEKKLSVVVQRLTHQEIEKTIGGRCNDKSHKIDNNNNDSRQITESTENTKAKSVLGQDEKNPRNKKVESKAKPKTESEIKKDDNVKVTRQSRRRQRVIKETKDAFKGLSSEVSKNNCDEIKPTRILRGARKADEKTKKSTTKKDEEITKSSLNHSIESHADNKAAKQASAETNSKPSTSESKNNELLKKNDFLPPISRRAKNVKTENVRKQEKMLISVPQNINETFIVATGACTKSIFNELVGTEEIDFIELPNMKLRPINTDNNYKAKAMKVVNAKTSYINISYEARSKRLKRACKIENVQKNDDPKPSRRWPITKANNEASKQSMPKSVGIKRVLNEREKQRNVALNKAILETSITEETVKPLETDDKQKIIKKLDNFKSESTESNYGEISFEIYSKKRLIRTRRTSTPRSAPKRKASSEVTHNNVINTPMRKIPKIRRSIFKNGNTTPNSLTNEENSRKLFHLSGTEDSDSESSFVKAFKSGIWKSISVSSISSIE